MKSEINLKVSRKLWAYIEVWLGSRVMYMNDPHNINNDAILISPSLLQDFIDTHPDADLEAPETHPSRKIIIWCE